MTLTVLTDDQIRALLENLTDAELDGFLGALTSALHEYSTRTQEGSATGTSIQQPERTAVRSAATGATTLFMPSCSSAGHCVKVITLSSASTTSTSAAAAAAAATTPAAPTRPAAIRPTGAITLFTPQGAPLGLLHASTLTAFRTALASLVPLRLRAADPRTIVVFGSGEQAYWHARLALMARGGASVRRVYFVAARAGAASADRCRAVVRRLRDGAAGPGWAAGCEFDVLARDEGEAFQEKLARVLCEADVVICCTPATEPLFDYGRLRASPGWRAKGRLVVAIGSYTPQMKELPGELVREALGRGEKEAGVVIVDTRGGRSRRPGELIEAGVRPEQLVELGELGVLGVTPAEGGDTKSKRADLAEWLRTGNVIYKSVGMGLMDLSVAMHMVDFAQQKGVGTHVQGFRGRMESVSRAVAPS